MSFQPEPGKAPEPVPDGDEGPEPDAAELQDFLEHVAAENGIDDPADD